MRVHNITKQCTRALMLLAVVVGGAIAPAGSITVPWVQSEVSAASGNFGCDWSLEDGVLTIEPGNLNTVASETNWPWYADRANITKVVIDGPVYTNVQAIGMFFEQSNLTEIVGLQYLDTSKTIIMTSMFQSCSSLAELDLSHFDTHLVNNMVAMFRYCSGLTKLNVSSFDMNNISFISNMFDGCSNLTKLDVSGFQLHMPYTYNSIFRNCSKLTELDLSGFKPSEVGSMGDMFKNTNSLWKLTLAKEFVLPNEDNGLVPPVLNTPFDLVRKVSSTSWRAVGDGSAQAPTGASFADINALRAYQNIDHGTPTNTYVWQGGLGDSVAQYTVQPSYTVTIPATITITSPTDPATGTVTLSANPKLPVDTHFIHVAATSQNDNAWKLTSAGDTTGAAYTLKHDADNLSTGAILDFEANGEQGAQAQTVAAQLTDPTHKFKYAGSYQDIVTFNITTAAS